MKFSTAIFACVLVCLLVVRLTSALEWNENSADGCDFKENNLTNAATHREECRLKCIETPECTHFTWTSWHHGTCWMKKGSVFTSDAFTTKDKTMFCGIVNVDEKPQLEM